MPQGSTAGQTVRDSGLWSVEHVDNDAVLHLAGDWRAGGDLPDSRTLFAALDRPGIVAVIVDTTRLEAPHGRLAGTLYGLQQLLAARAITLYYEQLPEHIGHLLALARPGSAPPARVRPRPNRLAAVALAASSRLHQVTAAIALVGQAAAMTPRALTGRAQVRWGDFVDLVRESGAASLPVVTVVNLLIGAVLGFVGAIQLQYFGAGMYLADLVGIAVAREMAAIMTAFVIAGRVGATFAAHIATMQANEEIDALRTIGVSPFEYLALPRLAALTLMMPLLYLYAAALAITGGMLVASLVLDTSYLGFLGRLQIAVDARHFVIGFVKSIAFGVLIALSGCYMGLHAGRNAAEVGRAATRSVVVSIIGIILIDAVFALCTNALGV